MSAGAAPGFAAGATAHACPPRGPGCGLASSPPSPAPAPRSRGDGGAHQRWHQRHYSCMSRGRGVTRARRPRSCSRACCLKGEVEESRLWTHVTTCAGSHASLPDRYCGADAAWGSGSLCDNLFPRAWPRDTDGLHFPLRVVHLVARASRPYPVPEPPRGLSQSQLLIQGRCSHAGLRTCG